MSERQEHDTRSGVFYGLATYAAWGLAPLYFRTLGGVTPLEVLAHRIVWSTLLLAVVLSVRGRWPELAGCVRSGRLRWALLLSSLLLAANWLVYVYAVGSGQVLQSSLGYFLNPLFSVFLGVLCLRERLRPGQWLALALAALGLGCLVWNAGQLPWVALALTGSFGLYGLVRKVARVDSLVGLAVETLVLLPVAAVFLAEEVLRGTASFAHGNRNLDGLLLLSGVVTTVPMLFFGQAVRRLRLSTLGFVQYLSPSLQFLLAVAVFGEPFQPAQGVGFACVWTALLMFSVDAVTAWRRRPRPPVSARKRAGVKAPSSSPPRRPTTPTET
jgi:chloramphenicol-sensitive protein RarD